MDTIHYILGSYAWAMNSRSIIARQNDPAASSDILALKGRRLVTISEVPKKELNSALLKSLTGGDNICARGNFKDEINFKPSHHIWMMSNEEPVIDPLDEALWSRIDIIPFDRQATEEERSKGELKNYFLKHERSGILNWLVKGYFMWREEGLKPPETMILLKDKIRKRNDDTGRFLDECFIFDPQLKTEKSKVLDMYKRWCVDNEPEKVLGRNSFYKEVEDRGFPEIHIGSNKYAFLGLTPKGGFIELRDTSKVADFSDAKPKVKMDL